MVVARITLSLLKNPLFMGVSPPPEGRFGPTFFKGWVEQKGGFSPRENKILDQPFLKVDGFICHGKSQGCG